MSGLVLNVKADAAGLTKIDQVLTRLETLLKNPTSVNLSGISAQAKKLETDTATASGKVALLERQLNTLSGASNKTTKDVAGTGGALAKTAADAKKAGASLNLLTASYSAFTKSMVGASGGMAVNFTALNAQATAARNLLANMAALTAEQRHTIASQQAVAGETAAVNAAFAKHSALIAEVTAAHSPLIASIEKETLATAQLYLTQGKITQARYNEIAGLEKQEAAQVKSAAALDKERLSVNLLALSHSELVATLRATEGGVLAFTSAVKYQGAAATALLEAMTVLNPELRAMMVQEQTSIGVMNAANKEMALQAELTQLMAVGQSEYVATLRAETLALAKLAVIKGAITQDRYEEIAGLKSTTAARVKDTTAIKAQTTAMKQATMAGTNLNGAMRGAAGASGTLWLSYGAILPLLAAFSAVTGTIKGYKEALNFEYAVGYMEALGRATGDTTASLGELKAGLLGIKDVAHGPNDLAISLKALMKAGFTAAESMSELQTLSRLATVAEEDLAVTTTAVISQFRAWSVESVGAARGVNTMSEAANVLAAAALTTTLDVGELAKMMKYTPVLASQSAASFVELTAALGTMSNMGVRGTTAATSLRTAMLQLQSPTSKTRGILKDLKLDIDLFSADGKLKSMSGMFDALSVSLKGLTDRKRLELLKSMFSIRAGSAGAIMLNQFNQAVKEGTFSFQAQVEMLEKVRKEGRFIDDMYKDLSKTTSVMWEETKATWQKVAIGVLDTASIQGLVKSFKDFAEDGSLATVATGLAVIVDVLMEMGHLTAQPFTKLGQSFQGVNESITTARVMLFGATEGFLAAQNASELYAKSLKVLPNYTNQEADAAARLVSVYGSLEKAAIVQPLDTKIGVVQQKFNALKDQESELLVGERNATNNTEAEYYKSKLDHMARYADELEKLRAEKKRMLEDPVSWWSTWDRMEGEKYDKTHDSDSVAAAVERAQDRRGVELSAAELRRSDVLSQDKFELQQLDRQMKDKLTSLAEYRSDKREIDDKILRDDLALLERQFNLAKDKFDEATDYAAGDVPDGNAGKAALAAETKMEKLAQKVRQKKLEQERADVAFAGESNSIRLRDDEEYSEMSLQLTSARAEREKVFALESVSQQLEVLEARNEAGLVFEQDYLDQKRNLQDAALDAEVDALNSQLGVLNTKRTEALALKDTVESAKEVRKLDDEIVAVNESLKAIDAQRDVMGNLIAVEDIVRAQTFSDILKDIRESTEEASAESALGLKTQDYSSGEQGLATARRGNILERDESISSLIEKEGPSKRTFGKVEKVSEAYQEKDDSLIGDYLLETSAELEDKNLSTYDEYGEKIKAAEEYYARNHELMINNTTLTEQQRTELEKQLTMDRLTQLNDLEAERASFVLSNSSEIFGGLAGLAKAFKGEQSKEYQAMFAISKAFAIADAMVSIQQGIASAWRLGWPAGLAAMGGVVASTAGIVSTIQGTEFSGAYDLGGDIPAGSFGLVGELGPELISGPAHITSRKDTAALMGQQQQQAPAAPQNIRIVNAFDTAVVGDYIGSDAGEKSVINVIKNNVTTMKSILG